MTFFNMKLAGYPFQVECLYENTKEFCQDYVCEDEPEFCVKITQADIDNERVIAYRQDEKEEREVRFFSDEYLETIALYRKLAKPLLDRDCIIFHGSSVVVDGKCYLFTAKSGVGKTTHTNLWLNNIADSYILNGDKPLIKISSECIILYGTPWRGKEKLGINGSAPLEAISLLERDVTNHIERIAPNEAFKVLFQQTHRMENSMDMVKELQLLGNLADGVRLFRLGCNMKNEAAIVSYRGMCSN